MLADVIRRQHAKCMHVYFAAVRLLEAQAEALRLRIQDLRLAGRAHGQENLRDLLPRRVGLPLLGLKKLLLADVTALQQQLLHGLADTLGLWRKELDHTLRRPN